MMLLFSAGFFCCILKAEARSDFSDYERVRHPLIQATDVLTEYKSLEALGFLDTGKWENSPREADASQSEYSRLLQQLSQETAYEKAKKSIVRISIGAYYGSGVIWEVREENVILVSNKHLLQNGQKGMVTFQNGVIAEGTVLTVSELLDIGFMQVPINALEREDWLALRFADKDEEYCENLRLGEEIFVIGSAADTGQEYYEGTIGNVSYYFPQFGTDMLYAYCRAVPGMSGGGTFDQQGHFIGMLTAGTENGELVSLPLKSIVKEYEKLLKYP